MLLNKRSFKVVPRSWSPWLTSYPLNLSSIRSKPPFLKGRLFPCRLVFFDLPHPSRLCSHLGLQLSINHIDLGSLYGLPSQAGGGLGFLPTRPIESFQYQCNDWI